MSVWFLTRGGAIAARFFKDRWIPLPYVYNSLKTLRVIHQNIWRDEDVRNVHYMSVSHYLSLDLSPSFFLTFSPQTRQALASASRQAPLQLG